ncbi:MAG: rhomboid family intramembrane serine protease [Spirochaetaceae bacterium]|jgi:membrane associated rhomboid family serine protease|nr:rhomboid family intramembrane serine protease [Spirochaetaceae bacterium]
MRIKYNAPVVLTFAFISAVVLIINQTVMNTLIESWFAVPGRGHFQFKSIHSWVTLVSHAIGHSGWEHLIGNFSLILLIGPILEERYGSTRLFFMMFVTALVTGVLNTFFFDTGLLGASGIVFMMILLASFTNFGKGEIPLTFILILALYLGQEIFNAFGNDDISQFGHIIGGLCGSFFGFSRKKKGFDPGTGSELLV